MSPMAFNFYGTLVSHISFFSVLLLLLTAWCPEKKYLADQIAFFFVLLPGIITEDRRTLLLLLTDVFFLACLSPLMLPTPYVDHHSVSVLLLQLALLSIIVGRVGGGGTSVEFGVRALYNYCGFLAAHLHFLHFFEPFYLRRSLSFLKKGPCCV